MRISLPHRPAHIALFLVLAFLCYQAHQWVRHLTGAVLCGGVGTVTLSVAIIRQPCSLPTLVTLSGPVLTYGLAYSGMLLLLYRKAPAFAYALIFASFAHLRWIQTLTGRGDEIVLAQQWFGVSNPGWVAVALFLIGLPPLLAAYRSIGNRDRLRVFGVSYLLPLPLLLVILLGDRLLFGASDLPSGGSVIAHPGPTILGISVIVLVVDLLAAGVLIAWGPRWVIDRE